MAYKPVIDGDDIADGSVQAQDLAAGIASLPIGTILDYAGVTAPSGFLLCDGNAVSRSVYSGLFAVIGTTFGAGDGSTTFNLPDLRGRIGVGLDNLGGSDAGRLAAANTLGDSGGSEKVTLTGANMPSHDHGGTITSGGNKADFDTAVTSQGGKADFNADVSSEGQKADFNADISITGGNHSHNFTYTAVDNTTIGGSSIRIGAITASVSSTTVSTQASTTHTHTLSAAALDNAQANHAHTILQGTLDAAQADHTHQITAAALDAAQVNHTHSVSVPSAYGNGSGGTDAHDNMQPYMLLGKIIKV